MTGNDTQQGDYQTTEERVDEVRRLAAEGVCYRCRKPVQVHDGSHVTGQSGVAAIADAVAHANRHPANTALEEADGEILYVVEDGYYPGDHCHFVDFSDIPPELRKSASINAISELTKRGLVVNSARWDPPRLHVMAVDDMVFDYYGGGPGGD